MKTALTAPRPLDVLQLPDDLDGRTGVNRATGRRQIAADDDLAAVRAWLARVADTKTTFENYARKPNGCCCGRSSSLASRCRRSRTRICLATSAS